MAATIPQPDAAPDAAPDPVPEPAQNGRAQAFLKARARSARPSILLAVGFALAAGLGAIAQAYLLAGLIDQALAGAALWAEERAALLALGVVVLVRLECGILAEIAGFAAGARLKADTRALVFERLLAAGPARAAEQEAGGAAIALTDRIEALEGFAARWLPAATLAAVLPLAMLVAAALHSGPVAALLAGFLVLAPLGLALSGIGAARASRRQFRMLERLGGRFLDRLRGLGTLIHYGQAEAEAARLGTAAHEFRLRTMAVLRLAFLSSAVLELCAMGAIAGVAFMVAPSVADGSLPRATGLFLLLLAVEFFQPLRAFALTYHDRASAAGAAEALAALVDAAPPADPAATLPVPDAGRIAIAFEDVHLAYEGGARPALSGLTLALAPGEAVAVTGPSGAGKSTLLDLLMGFRRPDRGRVLANGVPVERIAPERLRALSAWVGQRTHLFHGSLRENIRFARPDASDAEVDRAAAAAQVTAFLPALPQGLDTLLGERGFGLSGGQAQRVAIARAFLKDAPLLLLDEPTAHLDAETEAAVMQALRALAAGRTVLMASHSEAASAALGRRVRIEGGRIRADDGGGP
ncbi:MAG: thiol reductant ABC exporter subunit CydD [Alphaproteobacteria bacterium]|nr:thiol reductant ABC exporter subunit CydD [Alphaproteobacteria bacterium]